MELLWELLYSANLFLFVFSLAVAPLYLTRYFKISGLNLLTIPLFIALPVVSLTTFSGPYFFLDGSLFNPYFQYALLVNNVHTLLSALTILVLVRQFDKAPALSHWVQKFVRSGGQAHPERMRAAAWLFLALFAFAFVLLTKSFGLLNWIADPRTGYQLHRTGAGQWYALSLTLLSVSLVLAATYARSTYTILAAAPLYLFLIYLLGSKSFIIGFAVFYVIILAIRRFRYLVPVAAVILGAGAVSAILTFVQSLGGFGIAQISTYSDYYVNAAMYYRDYLSGNLPLYHGQMSLSSLWSVIPRSLYPDKPYVYGQILIDEHYFPGSAAQTSTPAFATIEYFADFGWPQVIVSAVFNFSNVSSAFLLAVILPRLRTFDQRTGIAHSRFLTYTWLYMAAPFFLYYFDFPLNAILFLVIMGLINLTNRLHVTARQPEAEPGAGSALPTT